MLTGALDNPVGDGGVRDKQFGALIMVCVFGPIGCVVVSLFISSIVREQGMSMALDARHEENKSFMQHAMRILNIPKDLQNRVFSLHYYQKMGHDKEAFDALFNKKNLSRALENALLVYLYRDTVCTSKYFLNKDPNYIIEVLRVLEFEVFLPGDYVGRRGEIASSMYFVSRGLCAILVPDPIDKSKVEKAKKVGNLAPGSYFGEVALIDDCVRTAWVRAESYALLSALHRKTVEPIWKYFPKEKDELKEVVLQNHKKDRQRLIKHRWKIGFDGAKMLQASSDALTSPDKSEEAVSNSQEAPDSHRASRGGSDDGGKNGGKGISGKDWAELKRNIAEILSRQAALEERVDRVLDGSRHSSDGTGFEKLESDMYVSQDLEQPTTLKKPAKPVKKWKVQKGESKKDDVQGGAKHNGTLLDSKGDTASASTSGKRASVIKESQRGEEPKEPTQPSTPSRSWRRTVVES